MPRNYLIYHKFYFQQISGIFGRLINAIREVAEWLKAHAWKVCIRQKRIEGSNPFLSASLLNIFLYL